MPHPLTDKYLRQIAAWASKVRVEEWFAALDTEEYGTLIQSVRSIHRPHVTEQDAAYLLLGALAHCLAGPSRERRGWLTDVKNEDLRNRFCDVVRERIESLPWDIQVHFPLPRFTDFSDITIKLSESISLKTAWDGPDSTPDAGQNMLAALVIPQKRAWLTVDVKGYIVEEAETGALSSAISQAKQCLYFLSLHSWVRSPRSQGQVVNAVATLPTSRQNIRLPYSLARYLGTLAPDDMSFTIYDTTTAKSLLGGELRQAITPGERASALEQKLGAARLFFARRGNADFDAIAAAIEWYMDSVTADNQTFAYIAACIGMEALLGYGETSERMDAMSSRLCDRYGFLLGAGRHERERLSREYHDILKLRGKLVHARSKRLMSVEQAKLNQVQHMLAGVIGKEIEVFISGDSIQ